MNHEAPFRSRYDVVIVGARAAGAATALLLARAGRRVLVVERGAYGSDTVSTHALMRGAVSQLHRFGVLDAVRAAGTPPVRVTSFHYGDEVVQVPIRARDGVDALYAPRRTVLDAALVDAAREAGAQVRYDTSVTALIEERGRVRGVVLHDGPGSAVPVRADLVIGADGMHSTVARLAVAPIEQEGRHRVSLIYGFFEGLADAGYQWRYRPGASAGLIPTNDGHTNVFVAFSPERRDRDRPRLFEEVLSYVAPDVASALEGTYAGHRFVAFPGHVGFLRRAHGPGWALVGDAGAFKDPLTAHGITSALRDAELLAHAMSRDTDAALAAYQAERDALARPLLESSDRIASLAWDLDELRQEHVRMAEAMSRESAFVSALRWPSAA